jgi:hypothetical protein
MNTDNVYALLIKGDTVFAGTLHNGVMYSTNHGSTWLPLNLSNKAIYSLANKDNNLFAGSNNGIYVSTNGGNNWDLRNEGLNFTPVCSAILISGNYAITGINLHSIWRRSLSEVIGIKNISTKIPVSTALYQNYPNPFNPSTIIKFDIKNPGFFSLKIYNSSGSEIETLVNSNLSTGTYEVNWNASEYASGIYFYVIRSGNFMESKKMLLIK